MSPAVPIEAMNARPGDVIRARRLAIAEMLGDLPDLNRAGFAQEMDQFEAAGAGHRLEERGLKAVDAVLGSQHGSALACGRGRHEPEDMAVFARDLEGVRHWATPGLGAIRGI